MHMIGLIDVVGERVLEERRSLYKGISALLGFTAELRCFPIADVVALRQVSTRLDTSRHVPTHPDTSRHSTHSLVCVGYATFVVILPVLIIVVFWVLSSFIVYIILPFTPLALSNCSTSLSITLSNACWRSTKHMNIGLLNSIDFSAICRSMIASTMDLFCLTRWERCQYFWSFRSTGSERAIHSEKTKQNYNTVGPAGPMSAERKV